MSHWELAGETPEGISRYPDEGAATKSPRKTRTSVRNRSQVRVGMGNVYGSEATERLGDGNLLKDICQFLDKQGRKGETLLKWWGSAYAETSR